MDYVYPSIFFSYFLFFIFLVGALFFFARSFRDGYWGGDSEETKFRMLKDGDGDEVAFRIREEVNRVRQ
jgi:hypothetical protein